MPDPLVVPENQLAGRNDLIEDEVIGLFAVIVHYILADPGIRGDIVPGDHQHPHMPVAVLVEAFHRGKTDSTGVTIHPLELYQYNRVAPAKKRGVTIQ